MKLITLGNLETFKNKINEKYSKSNYKNAIAQSKEQMDTGNYCLGYYSYNSNDIDVLGTCIPKGTYSVKQWSAYMKAIFGKDPNDAYNSSFNLTKKFYANSTATIEQNGKELFTFDAAYKTCYLIGIHNSGGIHISLFSSNLEIQNHIGQSNDHIILYCSNSTGLFSNYKSFPIELSADLYFKDV